MVSGLFLTIRTKWLSILITCRYGQLFELLLLACSCLEMAPRDIHDLSKSTILFVRSGLSVLVNLMTLFQFAQGSYQL